MRSRALSRMLVVGFALALSVFMVQYSRAQLSRPPVKLTVVEGSPRLSARPGAVADRAPEGLTPLRIARDRDAFLFVPHNIKSGAKVPLLLLLHGATMRPQSQLALFQALADSNGVALVAVKSLDYTWDAIRGDYGVDIAFIDAALKTAFSRVLVDRARVGVAGFSDGASYALGLAISNGDLFSKCMALSAGFVPPTEPQGKPAFFIAHGTADQILPIERGGRFISGALEKQGYAVKYEEFEGPHTVPAPIAREAMVWFLKN